ncbi:MAG: LysE family transporter [Chitinophagales bacterium]|nr:LysE family transporter [Chitinophagales bacterium]
MHLWDALLKGTALGLFLAISVGPTLFAILKYSLNHSYRAGIAFILGVSISDILYVTVANLAASWLEVLHEYSKEIAYGGAVILIVVGVAGLVGKYRPVRPSATKLNISNTDYVRIWTSGFLINTINPAVIIIWLGSVSATANTSGWYRLVMFSVCLSLVLGIDFCKVFLADAIRRKLTLRRVMYLQKTSSAIILTFGAALFLTTYFDLHINRNGLQSAHYQKQFKEEFKTSETLVSLQPHV